MVDVKEGDIIDVKIELVGNNKEGVAKYNDYVIFVPDTVEGQLKVKITKILEKVAFAEKVN